MSNRTNDSPKPGCVRGTVPGGARARAAALALACVALCLACIPSGTVRTGAAAKPGGSSAWLAAEVHPGFPDSPVRYYRAATGTGPAAIPEAAPLPAGEESAATPLPGKTAEPFVVADFGPAGVLPSAIRKPTIHVVFSEPVVPLASLGDVLRSTPIMKIEPSLKGVYRWYGTRMLAFEADDDLVPERMYTVTVGPNVRSLAGTKLDGRTTFTFHTEFLKMESIVPGDVPGGSGGEGDGYGYDYEYYDDSSRTDDVPLDKASDFLVRFSWPVDPQVVAKGLALEFGGVPAGFTASRPQKREGVEYEGGIDRWIRIRTKERPPQDTDVVLTLREGARSGARSLPVESPSSLSFHTLRPFSFSDHSEYSWEYERGDDPDRRPHFIYFSHPVKPESVAKAFSVEPGVALAPGSIGSSGRIVRLNGLSLAPETNYTITVDGSVEDVYGRSLGAPVVVRFKTAAHASYVSFPDRGARMLESAFPPRVLWEVKNMHSGAMKVAPLDDPYAPVPASQLAPVNISGIPRNTARASIIDLAPMLNAEGKGVVGIGWSFRQTATSRETRSGSLQVQVTDLGLTMRYGYDRFVGIVTKLSTGAPVAGAVVSLASDRNVVMSGRTGADGMIAFEFAPGRFRESFVEFLPRVRNTLRVIVESGMDRIEFVPNGSHDVYSRGVQATGSPRSVEEAKQVTFLFSDRKLYRSGEEVSFRGIDRDLVTGVYSPYEGPYSVALLPPDWDAEPLAVLRGTASRMGGFHGTFTLPEGAEPGEYSLVYERGPRSRYETPGRRSYQDNEVREWIEVAAFRKQTFSVDLAASRETLVAGDGLSMSFSARYLSGGALGGAAWNGYWTSDQGWFDFGDAWREYAFGPGTWAPRRTLDTKSGTLDATGSGSASLALSATGPGADGSPRVYGFNLDVQDEMSGQLVGSSRTVFVHPAAFAAGLKLRGSGGSWFPVASAGKEAVFEYVLVGTDGTALADGTKRKIDFTVLRIEWKVAQQQGGGSRISSRYERVETPVKTESRTAAGASGSFSYTPDAPGEYVLRLSGADGAGRPVRTSLSFYATGSGYVRWNSPDADAIELTADRVVYRPGETARVLVKSPLPAGTYLLTVEREGIWEERLVTLDGSTATIDIPIAEKHVPVVYVALSSYTVRTGRPPSVRGEPDLDKPKGLFGIVALPVDPASRRIHLDVKPGKETYLPGEKAEVVIVATDDAGLPVAGAELSFMAADRGVLDLVDYHVPDPLAFFYSPWNFPLATSGADTRSLLLDPVTYEIKDLQGGSGDDEKNGERDDFRSSAVFLPLLETGPDGRAVARFAWPDSLTTWRCTAVAVTRERFGIAEKEIQVRNPVNLKAVVPPRLRVRDDFYLGFMVTNLESSRREVRLACSSDILDPVGETAKSLSLGPGETGRIDFRFAATRAGEGSVVCSLESDGFRDRLREPVLVETPLLSETVALMGSTDATAREGLVIPSTPTGAGHIELTLADSRLPALADAFAYLFRYPYGCIEQQSSALMPLVLFGPYIDEYGIGSEVVDVRGTVDLGLAAIAREQRSDGGFPSWPSGRASNPYVSVRVAHLMLEAYRAGYPMPPKIDFGKLVAYITAPGKNVFVSDHVAAYTTYVLAEYGRNVRTRADAIAATGPRTGIANLSLAALAYLAMGDRAKAGELAATLRTYLRPNLRSVDLTDPGESAGPWHFGSRSDVESLSMLLMLQHRLAPEDEMIDRLARTIVAKQRSGYWRNTAETVWAMRALSEVIARERGSRSAGHATGSGTGRVLLDGAKLFEAALPGPDNAPVTRRFDFGGTELASVRRNAILPLEIVAAGIPMVHYTAVMRYSIPAEIAAARDEGLGLFTEAYTMDGKPADLSRLEQGRLYRMKVVLSSSKDRTFVAVTVPVASGCEIVDSRMVTASRAAQAGGNGESGEEDQDPDAYRRGYESRQTILDNGVRYFFDDLPKGAHLMEFVFRTYARGVFPVPPAVAECMYEPEIFGRDRGRLTLVGVDGGK